MTHDLLVAAGFVIVPLWQDYTGWRDTVTLLRQLCGRIATVVFNTKGGT
jgi:hypothetical protein